jgi:pimeloyl-ACP methyl ester carboxylesterase
MRTIFSLSFILFLFTNGFSQLKKTETVQLNDTQIYYEVYGEGEPLILLHGYTLSSKHWLPYILDFADKYEVYVIDLPGHGKSSPFKKDFSLKWIAEDVNALINYLELSDIKAIGYSYGGDVLYQMASINPDLVESIITIGSLPNRIATVDFPDLIKTFSVDNLENLSWISAYQIDEDQTKKILREFSKYNSTMTEEELKRIKAKILIIVGDDDPYVPLEKIPKVRNLLENSDLLILPNSGHEAHAGEYEDFFVKTAKKYFEAK